MEFAAEVGEKCVELGAAFGEVGAGDDDVFGEQAVLEGVAGGAGFSVGGFRAGGFLGVPPVGTALFFGDDLGHCEGSRGWADTWE